MIDLDEDRPALYNPELGDIETFIVQNKGMVYQMAFKYMRKTRLKVELDDLLQEGYIGLIKAYRQFNPTKGTISTIAYFWIRHEMICYIRDRLPLVRPPKRSYELAGKIILNKLKHSPPEEIALLLNASITAVENAIIQINSALPVSTNEKIEIPGNQRKEYEELFFSGDDQSDIEVRQFLEALTRQQRRVIELLMAGYKKVEVARELGVTRPRIGAIVASVEVMYWKHRRRCQ